MRTLILLLLLSVSANATDFAGFTMQSSLVEAAKVARELKLKTKEHHRKGNIDTVFIEKGPLKGAERTSLTFYQGKLVEVMITFDWSVNLLFIEDLAEKKFGKSDETFGFLPYQKRTDGYVVTLINDDALRMISIRDIKADEAMKEEKRQSEIKEIGKL